MSRSNYNYDDDLFCGEDLEEFGNGIIEEDERDDYDEDWDREGD